MLTSVDTGTGLSSYLNTMLQIFIGICIILALAMIVVGGLEYMTSELVSSKEAGRQKITGAILGLLLALGSYAILNTINPDLLNSELNLPEAVVRVRDEQIRGYSGQGRCEPITDPNSLCSPGRLAAAGFSSGENASAICNGESRGNPNAASGVDRCRDGNAFSFGLFQINIIANGSAIPGGVCSGVIQTNGGGTQGRCLDSRNGICIQYDCRVSDQARYQSCVNFITRPEENIRFAQRLQASGGWGQWGFNNSCRF